MELSIILQGQGGNPYGTLIMFGLIAVVFYFFMIRPQTKRAKKTKNFRETLKKGDKIVTIGGIHGKVVEVKDSNILMEAEGGQKLRVEKSAVSMEFTTGSGQSELVKPSK